MIEIIANTFGILMGLLSFLVGVISVLGAVYMITFGLSYMAGKAFQKASSASGVAFKMGAQAAPESKTEDGDSHVSGPFKEQAEQSKEYFDKLNNNAPNIVKIDSVRDVRYIKRA